MKKTKEPTTKEQNKYDKKAYQTCLQVSAQEGHTKKQADKCIGDGYLNCVGCPWIFSV
jgi:hypothetical protein